MAVQDLSNGDTKPVGRVIKKKRKPSMRKAPQAPKRFKSSYILFFLHVQVKIQDELGGKVSAPAVSKKTSELWKAISAEDRQYWDGEAKKDKERYMAEKIAYTGPRKVFYKRVKKNPNAPKRNPSAFLLFSQGKRQEIRKLNPGMKNTKTSGVLGQLWRNADSEKKRPYIEREMEERAQYKIDMAEWRKNTDQLSGEATGTPSGPVSIIEGDIGRMMQPVPLAHGVAACAHGGNNNIYHVDPYASHNSSTSQGNYGESIYPSHGMRHGHHLYHQQPNMHLEYPPQNQHINQYLPDVYPSGSLYRPQQQCRYLTPHQHGSNNINGRDFNHIPFPTNYCRSHLELNIQQQQGDDKNIFTPTSNNDYYLEYNLQKRVEQERNTNNHWQHNQSQHHQYSLEKSTERNVPSEQLGKIMENHYRDQYHYAQDNVH